MSGAAIPKTELGSPSAPCRTIVARLPEKLGFLLELHPYKVAYGGRNGAKSTSFAIALLMLGAAQKLRILCAREIQNSIKESVHAQLKDLIDQLGLGTFYTVFDTEIRGNNGTAFIFAGLSTHTATSIKSFANIDVCWVEEAQTVKKSSWDILIPTIRSTDITGTSTATTEIWVSFNPDMDTDDTWTRFVAHPPPGTIVAKVNYYDNPWHNAEQEAKRLHCKLTQPDDYDNIWEGACKTVVAGAIYSREVLQAIEEQRIRPIPYDPRFPVHCFWDLGWNDAMSIVMVQKTSPSSLNVINYIEDSFKRYDEFVADMNRLGYNWGEDWLPHDGAHGDPKTGKSAATILKELGRRLHKNKEGEDVMEKTGPEQRIRAARSVFPRVYIDDTARKRDTGFLGAARLVDCLKRYKRNVPKNTQEPTGPVHDQYSHGADAFSAMCEHVEEIRNNLEPKPIPLLPAFDNYDPGMGSLG